MTMRRQKRVARYGKPQQSEQGAVEVDTKHQRHIDKARTANRHIPKNSLTCYRHNSQRKAPMVYCMKAYCD
jgi:hypothetical protein